MTDLILEPRVRERIADVQRHIDRMRTERAGWGPVAMGEADATAASFVRGLSTLVAADRVWNDGATGLSFGGVLPGGIAFGMIARIAKPAVPADLTDGVKWPEFATPAIEWTFHS